MINISPRQVQWIPFVAETLEKFEDRGLILLYKEKCYIENIFLVLIKWINVNKTINQSAKIQKKHRNAILWYF